jgi:hypothetical protein
LFVLKRVFEFMSVINRANLRYSVCCNIHLYFFDVCVGFITRQMNRYGSQLIVGRKVLASAKTSFAVK